MEHTIAADHTVQRAKLPDSQCDVPAWPEMRVADWPNVGIAHCSYNVTAA